MPLCVHCPTARALLMSLMCSCWHKMFIFLLWLNNKQRWFMGAAGAGADFSWVGFPLCASSLYHTFFTMLFEWLALLVKHCVLFVTEKMAHHLQCCWLLTDRLMKSETKDLCSQHIPFFVFMTIHQHLVFRATFCLLKTCLECIPVHCVKSLRI